MPGSWLYILLIGCALNSPAQDNNTGIFLTIKIKKHCEKQLTTIYGKGKTCVAQSPILSAADFNGFTDIKNDSIKNISYFHILFTQDAFDKLKRVSATLSNAEFALVVDNKIVGFIKNADQIRNRSLQIDGKAYSEEIKWVHEKLKAFRQP